MVQFLNDSEYDIPADRYLIYLHGGKRSYWNTYETKADEYNVLGKYETISDHDKAIRKVKNDMNLEPINPKRHLFSLDLKQIKKLNKWFKDWNILNL
jgi:hypothetical protein